MSDSYQYSSRPEDLVKRLDQDFAALVRAFPEAAILLASDGAILTGNDAAAEAFGALRVGFPISLTVRAPEIVQAVREVSGGGASRLVPFNVRVPVERSFEAHIVPIGADRASGASASAPKFVLIAFRDLTPAMRIDQMRADFVANASHELRTPLASLTGFIDTLRGPAREDPVMREKFLGIMSEQARRMSRLIDDLLSLSRVELNLHVTPSSHVDLVSIVGHVRDTLAPLATERSVSMSFYKPEHPIVVLGERDDLIRLVENLVENALKYGADGKRIEIELRQEHGDAIFSVRDFGPGIAPDHLPRLTERFYRVDIAQSREQGGTGLGLAIVKHIVARHRGRLSIESELGDGARFSVRMPLSTGRPAGS